MQIGDVFVRDPRYVWRQRAAALEKHALVLRAPPPEPADVLVVVLDGSWSCEAVVVSAAHPHAVRLRELCSARELLVDAGSRGKRQMWVDLFANARRSASAIPATLSMASSSRSLTATVCESDLSEAADALAPVAGQLLRGQDVEELLLEHDSMVVSDERKAAAIAAQLVANGMLIPLFCCSCGGHKAAYASDSIYRVRREEVSAGLLAITDSVAPAPRLSRLQRHARHLKWSSDAACESLLSHFDRAESGMNGTEVVQALLQSGVHNVATAVVIANEMVQDGVIVAAFSNSDGGESASSEPTFDMQTNVIYKKETLDDTPEDMAPTVNSEPVDPRMSHDYLDLEKRLAASTRHYDQLVRVLCGVCVFMMADVSFSGSFPAFTKAGIAFALMLMLALRGGTATLAVNFRNMRGEEHGGMVTAGFFSNDYNIPQTITPPPVHHVAPPPTKLSDTVPSIAQPAQPATTERQLATYSDANKPSSPAAHTKPTFKRGLSTSGQAKALSFRQAIAQAAMVPLEATEAFADDYLFSVMSVKGRAFRYAVTKMVKILEWRRTFGVEQLVWKDVKARLTSGNMYWYGYDFQNRPILWVRAHLKDWKTMAQHRDEEVRAHIFLIELCCRELMPPGCTTFTIVSDASHLGTMMVDLRLMHSLLDTCVANYPDRIGMVHTGPLNRLLKYLSTVLWPFLPMRLRDKVTFMHDCATELSKHMQFDLIPKFMGGPADHRLCSPESQTDELDIAYMVKMQKERMKALHV